MIRAATPIANLEIGRNRTISAPDERSLAFDDLVKDYSNNDAPTIERPQARRPAHHQQQHQQQQQQQQKQPQTRRRNSCSAAATGVVGAKESVRFDNVVKVHHVPRYNKVARRKIWYSEWEIANIRQGLIQTVQLSSVLAQNSQVPTTPRKAGFEYDPRGTEGLTEEGNKQRNSDIRCVVTAVLLEQEFHQHQQEQRQQELVNEAPGDGRTASVVVCPDEALAMASRRFSAPARETALRMAEMDEVQVKQDRLVSIANEKENSQLRDSASSLSIIADTSCCLPNRPRLIRSLSFSVGR